MNSLVKGATRISYEDLRKKIDSESTGILSKHARPLEGEIAWTNECSIKFLLDSYTYPVWYMDPTYTKHRSYDAKDATKIRFIDAVNKVDFTKQFNKNRFPENPDELKISVIVFHCSTCGSYAVIDGNHRLTLNILSSNWDIGILLYGLSGSKWPAHTEDMEVICACNK